MMRLISLLALSLALVATGCKNIRKLKLGATNSNGTIATATAPNLVASSVSVSSGSNGSSGSSSATIHINFDSSQSDQSVSNVCQLSTCACEFNWSDVSDDDNTVVVPRTAITALLSVDDYEVTCNAPAAYDNEIENDANIQVALNPFGSSATSFTSNKLSFRKVNPNETFDFADQDGNHFDNIMRYTCYDTWKRGLELKNRFANVSKTARVNGQDVTYPAYTALASQFCTYKNCAATDDPANHLKSPDFSAQSYYYNLYVKSADKGSVNHSNDRFVCPKIDNPSEQIPNTNSLGFFPMDSSFALATSRSQVFRVGVQASVKLGVNEGDANFACSTRSTGSSNVNAGNATNPEKSMLSGCLGYAAIPNNDGTCPVYTAGDGTIQPMYRLRKYHILYPQRFDVDGTATTDTPPLDIVYVVDRPVNRPTSGGTANFPYAMRGPKPCPFAFFKDSKKFAGMANSKYVGTNNSGWEGANVDGIEFPFVDSFDNLTNRNVASCSAALPLLNNEHTSFTMGTVNVNNPRFKDHLYVRPVHAFAPRYEEDTDFLACAPLAKNVIDPPLHFQKTADGTSTWCAEVYPNANKTDNQFTTGNSTVHSSQHSVQGVDLIWKRFPIGADQTDTEAALQNQMGYACTMTADTNKARIDKTTPSGGCCVVGLPGHLEQPDSQCADPKNRVAY